MPPKEGSSEEKEEKELLTEEEMHNIIKKHLKTNATPADSGAFGEIFKPKLKNMALAVKRSKANDKDLTDLDLAQTQYTAELTTLEKLNPHPNIIKFKGSTHKTPYNYIFLELCHTTLSSAIRGGGLTLKDMIKVAIGAAEGLEHMHKSRIAHCDLKPDNIMLTQNNEVKLIDFGAATQFKKEGDIGTPGYFLEGKNGKKEKAGAERDIYAYGTVLLQLIRGDPDLIQVARRGQVLSIQDYAHSEHNNKELARKELLTGENTKEVEELVHLAKECFSKNPHSRPAIKTVLEKLKSFKSAN